MFQENVVSYCKKTSSYTLVSFPDHFSPHVWWKMVWERDYLWLAYMHVN